MVISRPLPSEALASKKQIDVGGVKIGGGNLAMIAGPCAVEEPERMDSIASAIKAAGVRAG